VNRVLISCRWQLAWWGTNVIGIGLFVYCIGQPPPWWRLLALFIAYLTGFLAAVLVEIATAK
jgi:ABC-type multidrug transport system permease subunit